jgi:hypothetical protein
MTNAIELSDTVANPVSYLPAPPKDPSDYDIDLWSSGTGWCGTFGVLIRAVVDDIMSDAQPWEFEITLRDGAVVVGTIEPLVWRALTKAKKRALLPVLIGDDEGRFINIDDVARLRA